MVRRQTIPWASRDFFDAPTIGAASVSLELRRFRLARGRLTIRRMMLLHGSDKDGKWRQGHVIQINVLLDALIGK